MMPRRPKKGLTLGLWLFISERNITNLPISTKRKEKKQRERAYSYIHVRQNIVLYFPFASIADFFSFFSHTCLFYSKNNNNNNLSVYYDGTLSTSCNALIWRKKILTAFQHAAKHDASRWDLIDTRPRPTKSLGSTCPSARESALGTSGASSRGAPSGGWFSPLGSCSPHQQQRAYKQMHFLVPLAQTK